MSKLGYIPALDGLRGISILLVMLHHLDLPWFQVGFIGVDIFFVLSGFLITSILYSEWTQTGSINLRRFYLRRILRLWPCLFAMIAASIVLLLLFGSPSEQSATWNGVWSSLLYISNWRLSIASSIGLGPLGTTWSLSIEDQFYIVWALCLPALLRFVKRNTLVFFTVVLAMLSLFACAIRWYLFSDYAGAYLDSDARAYALLMGCTAGLLYSSGKLVKSPGLLWALRSISGVGVVCILLINIFADDVLPVMYSGGFGIVAVTAVALILFVVVVSQNSPRPISFLTWKPLLYIGRISYGLYLWHALIFWLLQPTRLHADPLLLNIAAIVLAFTTASLSYHFIETPVQRWGRGLRFNNQPQTAKPILNTT